MSSMPRSYHHRIRGLHTGVESMTKTKSPATCHGALKDSRTPSPTPSPTGNGQCQKTVARQTESALSLIFWRSQSTWRRAGVNTLRCLVGCTLGDFSTMWFLQSQYPVLGTATIMALSMTAGLASSLTLETVLLRYGVDRLDWRAAVTTAAGMSTVSMLSMEAAQNFVDYHLMGGVVDFSSPTFWAAAGASMVAGFLTPLPYNYIRLRKYGKACH